MGDVSGSISIPIAISIAMKYSQRQSPCLSPGPKNQVLKDKINEAEDIE
jgi:hypothetical protein